MLAVNSTLQDLCDTDNDQYGCQQLCVLTPSGHRQCACSVGFKLDVNQRSCTPTAGLLRVSVIYYVHCVTAKFELKVWRYANFVCVK